MAFPVACGVTVAVLVVAAFVALGLAATARAPLGFAVVECTLLAFAAVE